MQGNAEPVALTHEPVQSCVVKLTIGEIGAEDYAGKTGTAHRIDFVQHRVNIRFGKDEIARTRTDHRIDRNW